MSWRSSFTSILVNSSRFRLLTETNRCCCHSLNLAVRASSAVSSSSGSQKLTEVNSIQSRLNSVAVSEDSEIAEDRLAEGIIANVDEQLISHTHGRLFAVVHINGKQFKVTNDDLILIQTNDLFPDVGERIRIEKVLLAGGTDFTLIGRPLLKNVVVEATIIEKTLGYAKAWYHYKRRKNVRQFRLTQEMQTVLRINSIEVQESQV